VRRNLGAAAPPAETPLVLIGREDRRRVVLAADLAALRAGLRIGMPATKAQALVKGLIVKDAELAADADALERLALWALRYAPIAAADQPDGLVIDTTSAAHLHGGEHTMVTTIQVGRRRRHRVPRRDASSRRGEAALKGR
jgi:protein ImuB